MGKRVAVVTSDIPFAEGGHMVIARSTVRALRDCGHEATLVLTPQNRFGRQFRAYLATRMTDVEMDAFDRKIDQVVSFRFPSFAVKHPVHVCWLNHRLREYYDLWPMLKAQLGVKDKLKESLRRRLIHILDTWLLKHNVTKLFTLSKTLQGRLQRWGRIPSEVLYPPPPQRCYRTEGYENIIFSVSRLQKIKRLKLLVESFSLVADREVRALIIGDGPELEGLRALAREKGLEKRVVFMGAMDEEAVLTHYARCRAVFFCPYQEDYGLIVPEAFASRKAVITASDSGGPTEIVKDGETGFICDPSPEALAARIDELAADPARAERMGAAAAAFVSRMTWEGTVDKLISVG